MLRIPGWSDTTSVQVNGEAVAGAVPGSYLTIDRTWKEGDVIDLALDMALHTWVGDEEADGKVSLYFGPLLLAFDQKYNACDTNAIPALDYERLGFERCENAGGWFPPIVLFRFTATDGTPLSLCDFASAGAYGTSYASWLPVVNAPPASFMLDQPGPEAAVPVGPNRFVWKGPRRAVGKSYRLVIARDAAVENKVFERADISERRCVVDPGVEAGTRCFWQVWAENAAGRAEAEDGPRAFVVDASLENPLLAHPALLEYREDGLVAGAYLDGDGTPVYGYVEEGRNVAPAEDRHGREGKAIHFSGNGMVRYRFPKFPAEYTVLFWAKPAAQATGALEQLFSAWSRSMDDPLRIFLRGSELFAAIEAGAVAGTPATPIARGQWRHVAVVKQGNAVALYLDGEKQHTFTAPADVAKTWAEDIAIGANPHFSGGEFYSGDMDDFAFYARPFSDETVKKIYEEGLSLEN